MKSINPIDFQSVSLEGEALAGVIIIICWLGGVFGYMAIRSHLLTKKGLDWFGEKIK